MNAPVITRFAPSPTGYLHIGGARTALFNWLFAKHHGGKMLLRIEDTDRARSTTDAIDAILDNLSWLGLNWDDEVVYQHNRAERHAAVAYELLAGGKAYKCFCTQEELAVMRDNAKAAGKSVLYDGTWRNRDPAEAPEGINPVIRFKSPNDGQTVIQDRVQGRVVTENEQLDDLILLRNDGSPTYMLSVVVDDHDMGVTHVIRGDDHLTNAARQAQIIAAMNWDLPVFAHIPLIHGPDGAKLSKRHGALGVDAYRIMGYLPQAIRNYLVRLGWSHGDEEIMSLDAMIEWFNLEAIGRGPARIDFDKLAHLNGHYIRETDDSGLSDAVLNLAENSDASFPLPDNLTEEDKATLTRAMPAIKDRAKTLVDLASSATFLFAARPISLDEKAAKLVTPDSTGILSKFIAPLTDIDPWTVEQIEVTIRKFAEEEGIKLGNIAQPLRSVLTGTTTSPGIFDVLYLLGRNSAISRIRDQIQREN